MGLGDMSLHLCYCSGRRNHLAKDKELIERITTLVLPEELAAITILSRADGRTVSAYARRVIQADIERGRNAKLFTDSDVKAELKSWKKE